MERFYIVLVVDALELVTFNTFERCFNSAVFKIEICSYDLVNNVLLVFLLLVLNSWNMKMASFSSLKIVEGPSFVLSWFDKTKINVPGFKIRKLASWCRLVESGLTLSKLVLQSKNWSGWPWGSNQFLWKIPIFKPLRF